MKELRDLVGSTFFRLNRAVSAAHKSECVRQPRFFLGDGMG